jgi:hypothetical protein
MEKLPRFVCPLTFIAGQLSASAQDGKMPAVAKNTPT